MRLADFLVDFAVVLKASRSVASKHVALRARQLDRYGQTSSIAASLRAKQHQWPESGPAAPSGDPVPQSRTSPVEKPSNEDSGTAEPVAQDGSSAGIPYGSPSLDGLPSFRIGKLQSRFDSARPPIQSSAHPLPRQTSNEAPGSGKPEFVPASWAGLPSSAPIRGVPRGASSPDPPRGPATGKDSTPSEPGTLPTGVRPTQGTGTSGPPEGPETVAASSSDSPSPQPVASDGADGSEASLSKDYDERGGGVLEEHTSQSTKGTLTGAPHDASSKSAGLQGQETANSHAATRSELSSDEAELVGSLIQPAPSATYQLRESKVPATRLSRLWNYSGLAAGMFAGAIGEGFSRAVGGGGSGEGSVILSAGNMERLVSKLSRMRGAALKLGQMMSIQDSKALPGPLQEVLQRVQDRADYMPSWQRDRVLVENLGAEWRELFSTFDEKPMAAASIGQVHRATLRSSGRDVAVKIQFPGVADSINSDLDNLGVLLAATRLLPKGLYLNKTIDNARTELAWECDYEREARCAQRYRELLSDETDAFVVPDIFSEASGKQVLTMEYMHGTGVTRVTSFSQEQRDWIGTQILRLCLREITEFKFMQTDPNWTNFLYNADKSRLELLDFGASREYPDAFVSLYVRLLEAASRVDRAAVKSLSEELGYLTGHESKAMLDAHITSIVTVAEPFLASAPDVYDFKDQTITDRVRAQIPVMIRERLAPPPEETYSLHRKLSGAFLLCARLGSRVRCRELFEQALKKTGYASG